MRDLNYQLKKLSRDSREGSISTRVRRERILSATADQLHELGYRRMGARSLKQKHVEALVKLWQEQKLSPGTIKKGGREQQVPIRTNAQRQLVEEAKKFVGKGALIPPTRNYIQQLRIYERHTANAGLSKMHGLRHAYAQQRYQELTGWISTVG